MTLCEIPLLVFITINAVHCDYLYFTFASSEYEYLAPSQAVFRINISFPVTVDRKQYRDLWVYRNGFVTLGTALEEETFPILTGSGTMEYQSFENLIGENIIAVFIVVCDNVDGQVRLKEFFSKSLTVSNKKTFDYLENIVLKAYGETVFKSIEHVIVIEWENIEIKGESTKNSFRLYILSNYMQSFVILQYWNIQSVTYRLFDKTFQYQSGIKSYANRNFILSFHNISDKENSLTNKTRWSNIGLDNTWLLNLGDISYSIDLGLPIVPKPFGLQPSKRKLQNDKSYEKKMTYSGSHGVVQPLIERSVDVSNKKKHSFFERKVTKTPSTAKYLASLSKVPLSHTLKSDKNTLMTTISRNKLMLNNYVSRRRLSSETLMENVRGHTKHKPKRYSPFINSTKQMKTKTTSIHLLPPNTSTAVPNVLREYLQAKNFYQEKEGNDNYSYNNQQCSHDSCGINQQCLKYKKSSCCTCLPDTIHTVNDCSRKDSNLKMRSFGSVSILQGTLILNLSIVITVLDHLQITHITLQSNRKMEQKLRNFILVLYPVFHIPMAFYASSWQQQRVPNLSELVGSMAAINTYIQIEGYGDLYVTFNFNRTKGDHWIIAINYLDVERLAFFNFGGLKFDEKSKIPSYLKYILNNKSSIDFAEQAIYFSEENKTVKVTWTGSMTFTANCLSNNIGNREYFVKFADNGYCNTDCTGAEDSNCRMMCLSYPYVFEKIPDSCEGTICPHLKVCLVQGDRYDCQCSSGLISVGDNCIDPITSSTQRNAPLRPKTYNACADCSFFSSCRILNLQKCCLCNSGYVGTGLSCFPRESEFEYNGFGYISLSNINTEIMTKVGYRLHFRQYFSGSTINYATIIEAGSFSYKTLQEKNTFRFIYLLSPIFDIPMSLFAVDKTKNFMTSIYALSKGSLTFTVKVAGIFPTSLLIHLNITERKDSLETNISVEGYPSEHNLTMWIKDQILFERKTFPEIKYKVRDKRILLLPFSINPFGHLSSKTWEISGSGQLGECINLDGEERLLVVNMGPFSYCNLKVQDQHSQHYCQTIPQLQIVMSGKCSTSCHQKAKCINRVCVCQLGYTGDGLNCNVIKKILECQNNYDCNQTSLLECREKKCLCKSGTVLREDKCEITETCQNCKTNEYCEEKKCVCAAQFIRNRISNQCTFDCSLCDIYSTTCNHDKCSCKSNFVYEMISNISCVLQCHSDSDCPENEFCNHMNKCQCPKKKVDGLCQEECNTCNKNAICINNKCQCNSEWIGNGLDCRYNCSLCFSNLYCDPFGGCSCPPNFFGDGKKCEDVRCQTCPVNSVCKQFGLNYRCECINGMIKSGDECIKDKIQIDIMPPGPIFANYESSVEIHCFAVSKITKFGLTWSRKSGKSIRGFQYYLDGTNTTLQLMISNMKEEDNDDYICGSSFGESEAISVHTVPRLLQSKVYSSSTVFGTTASNSVTNNSNIFSKIFTLTSLNPVNNSNSAMNGISDSKSCLNSCNKYALCISGKCRCHMQYIGDGINCVKRNMCPSECSENMICKEGLGLCQCRPGFIEENLKCFHDCREENLCDNNGVCNKNTGRCYCRTGYVGNGTKCWEKRLSCLLTKKCGSHSSCIKVEDFQQDICVCNNGYIGDGHICIRKITCGRDSCGLNSFCEPAIIKDHYGDLKMNGKCSCEPGYSKVNGKCEDPQVTNKTLWIIMGEAIISLGINENKSRIRYIDRCSEDKAKYGVILSLAADCFLKRLYWSSQKGTVIRSSFINNITKTIDLMSGLGKVTGLTVEEITGNIYFTDSYRGTIAVIDPVRNLSKIIINLTDYQPGQIVSHSSSGTLFWTVNDLTNPRIEMSSMTGSKRKQFVSLKSRPISLVVIYREKSNDSLCWMELNEKVANNDMISKPLIYGVIRCTNIIGNKDPPFIQDIYNVTTEEPSSAFTYSGQFYWGVRKGKFLRLFDKSLSQIPIKPNCCDISVRGILIMSEQCHRKKPNINPCFSNNKHVCSHLCVLEVNSNDKMRPSCLQRGRV